MSADAWNIIFGGIAGAALTAAVAVFLYFGQRRDTNEQIVDAKNEALAAEKRSVERTMAAEERAEQRALAAEERTKKAGAEGETRAARGVSRGVLFREDVVGVVAPREGGPTGPGGALDRRRALAYVSPSLGPCARLCVG
jgi:hypothetical protein